MGTAFIELGRRDCYGRLSEKLNMWMSPASALQGSGTILNFLARVGVIAVGIAYRVRPSVRSVGRLGKWLLGHG
jgi:hypothetical protein